MKISFLPIKLVVLLVIVSACKSCEDPSYTPSLEEAVRMSTIVLQGVAINHTEGPTPTSPLVLVSVECIFKDEGTELESAIQVLEVEDKQHSGLCFESKLKEGSSYILFLRDGGSHVYTQQSAALEAATVHLDSGCDLGGSARTFSVPKGATAESVTCPGITYRPCPFPTTPQSSGKRTKLPSNNRPHTAPPRSTASYDVTTPNERKHPRTAGHNSSSHPVAMATALLGAMTGVLLRGILL